jgi:multiple sugar transport system permease protein
MIVIWSVRETLHQLRAGHDPLLLASTLFTLPCGEPVQGAYASDWGGLMPVTSVAAVPFLIIFILAQRQIVEGTALTRSKT